MKKWILATGLLFWVNTVSANLVISPGVGYISQSTEESTPNTTNTSSTSTMLDFRLGYVLPMGLYVGGTYSHMNQEFCAGNTCTDSSGFLLGPTVGYFSMMGFYTLLTYHIMGESGDGPTNTGGRGPQVDVGWVFPITAYFSLGPQLTWRNVEYEQQENNGVTVDTDENNSFIAPYISLWFMF
jgi:hypothetical protein